MPYFNIVAETSENTVVTEYEPVKKRSDSYQSEAALEQEFIRLLCEQGYEYLPIHTEKDLIVNLRKKLEELNNYQFSDTEWDDFFKNAVANPNEHIVEKTQKIQEDNVQVLTRDDGSSKNITLIDKKNIHNNRLQVINQYKVNAAAGSREGSLGCVVGTENGAKYDNRYDVTVLVNGLPLVHIELYIPSPTGLIRNFCESLFAYAANFAFAPFASVPISSTYVPFPSNALKIIYPSPASSICHFCSELPENSYC